MNLTGGGAFYSQTPKSCLEDLGVNKGVNKGSFSKGAGVKHLRILTCDVILNGVKKRRNSHKCLTQRFFEQSNPNDKIKSPLPPFNKGGKTASLVREVSRSDGGFENTLCHSERSEESQSLANIVSKKILNYPTSTLPCNARPSQTRGAEVQDDWLSSLSKVREDKKPAFTLAEVLITLGIVGIIAAMTLPMLAENYQRRIVETRLKKFYTTFNQAILRSIDVNGPIDGWGYLINDEKDANNNNINKVAVTNEVFDLYLRPHLNIVQTQKIVYTNNTEQWLYYLSDGSAFMYASTWHNRDIIYYPKDPVKCLMQPATNRTGVCGFYFTFLGYSAYFARDPRSRHNYGKGLDPLKYVWDGSEEALYTEPQYNYGCSLSGVYCTALIQYNDWQFPKDYPRKIRY